MPALFINTSIFYPFLFISDVKDLILWGSNKSSWCALTIEFLCFLSNVFIVYVAAWTFLQAISTWFPYFYTNFSTILAPIPLLQPVTIIFFSVVIRKINRKSYNLNNLYYFKIQTVSYKLLAILILSEFLKNQSLFSQNTANY